MQLPSHSVTRWRQLWRALGATECDDALYHELLARYQAPERHYHTIDHLEDMLVLWQRHEQALRPQHAAEVEIAIWFHDAIHDPLRGDNERRSAVWARSALAAAAVPDDACTRVELLIMATRHADVPADHDAQILADLDLAILAASPERFEEYEHQIRAEYAEVPVTTYREKRREILERFLARPRIFQTQLFNHACERQARTNLEHSVEALAR